MTRTETANRAKAGAGGGKDLRAAQMRRAAELYYEQSLQQQEIGRIMGCSPATVSRLLAAAQDAGIVRVTIQREGARVPSLARALREMFGVREAIVVAEEGSPEANLKAVGAAAAELLLSVVEPYSKIGITWGQTLALMVETLPTGAQEQPRLEGIEVLQLSGSLGQGNPEVDGPQLALRLANYFGGICRLVPAPTLVDTAELRNMLLNQSQVGEALSRAAHPDIVVQGIGCLEPSMCSLQRAGYLDDQEMKAAVEAGAVGHLFARMIDANGNEVGNLSERVIAVPLDSIKRARMSIGLSASVAKVPAILGALRAGFFNTLVIDEASARQVLQLATAEDPSPASSRQENYT